MATTLAGLLAAPLTVDPLLIACGNAHHRGDQFVAPKVRGRSSLDPPGGGLAIGFLPQVGAIEVRAVSSWRWFSPASLFRRRSHATDFPPQIQAVAMFRDPPRLPLFAVGFVLAGSGHLPGVALGAICPRPALAVSIASTRRLPADHHGA